MTTHYWGDGFDFQRLNAAGLQIANIFKELSGLSLSWKEKYGTLRFELFVDTRLPVDHDNGIAFVNLCNEHFLFAVLITVTDYPDLASEILDDFLYHDKWDDINKHRLNKP